MPAAGMGLWPWVLMCPCDSNWGNWDPGAATGQADCPSSAKGAVHIVHRYICIYTLTKRSSYCSARKGEQDEIADAGGVYVSALCGCADLRGWL